MDSPGGGLRFIYNLVRSCRQPRVRLPTLDRGAHDEDRLSRRRQGRVAFRSHLGRRHRLSGHRVSMRAIQRGSLTCARSCRAVIALREAECCALARTNYRSITDALAGESPAAEARAVRPPAPRGAGPCVPPCWRAGCSQFPQCPGLRSSRLVGRSVCSQAHRPTTSRASVPHRLLQLGSLGSGPPPWSSNRGSPTSATIHSSVPRSRTSFPNSAFSSWSHEARSVHTSAPAPAARSSLVARETTSPFTPRSACAFQLPALGWRVGSFELGLPISGARL